VGVWDDGRDEDGNGGGFRMRMRRGLALKLFSYCELIVSCESRDG